MTYAAVRREMRCAFACGSGMVELYNDYALMNSINGGKLWADLAECIAWQKKNADVLPDIHWVGGNPWDGSKANVYGWASWNGTKSTLALRNGSNQVQTYITTLRQALDIPENIHGKIVFQKAFADQASLSGLTAGHEYDIDELLTLKLTASSVYVFDGLDSEVALSITSPQNTMVTLPSSSNQMFDLSGRRITTAPHHGIYISGNRKFLR